MPRAVTVKPPSSVIFPPLVADVAVIFEIIVVVKVGMPSSVVKLSSFPYVVPVAFIA